MSDEYATVNDYEISWSSIKITLNIDGGGTLKALDCEGVKWGRKLDTGRSYGTGGGRPMKETEGKIDYDGSLIFTRSGIDALEDALIAAGAPTRGNQVLIGLVRFTTVVQHSTKANPSKVYTTRMKGCRYRGDTDDMKPGVDPDTVEVDVKPMEVVRVKNGKEICII